MNDSELIDITNSPIDYQQVECPVCGANRDQPCWEVKEDPEGLEDTEEYWLELNDQIHKSRVNKADNLTK